MKVQHIPKELLHIILEYDGRIKYRNGKYINSIDKNDKRYDIIKPVISKSLSYSNDFNIFEMCYYDSRNARHRIRTYI